MDPAFVNWGLYQCGLDAAPLRLATICCKPCATELMRLNKSFIVKRSAKGPREIAKTFSELSSYIADSLREVTTSGLLKEGRAKTVMIGLLIRRS